MTREEAKHILAGYVKACQEDDTFTLVSSFNYKEVLEAMLMGADALSEPSLPSDVDEAAEKYNLATEMESPYVRRLKSEAFKAGAKWMRNKMLGEAVEIGETNIYWEKDGDRAFPTLDPPAEDLLMPGIISQKFNDGDKVRIVVLKAEEG